MTGDNTLAEVTFPSISDDTVNINHTFVDHSLRGSGRSRQTNNETAKFLQDQNKEGGF